MTGVSSVLMTGVRTSRASGADVGRSWPRSGLSPRSFGWGRSSCFVKEGLRARVLLLHGVCVDKYLCLQTLPFSLCREEVGVPLSPSNVEPVTVDLDFFLFPFFSLPPSRLGDLCQTVKVYDHGLFPRNGSVGPDTRVPTVRVDLDPGLGPSTVPLSIPVHPPAVSLRWPLVSLFVYVFTAKSRAEGECFTAGQGGERKGGEGEGGRKERGKREEIK